MKKAERAIMWIGAIGTLIFSITQTAAAIIRGEWFVSFYFAVMIGISMGMMQEARKEESDDSD